MTEALLTPRSDSDIPVIHGYELDRGLGFTRYPVDLLNLAVLIYEQSGFIVPQTMLLDYDPDYISDFSKMLRIKQAVNRKKGHAATDDDYS